MPYLWGMVALKARVHENVQRLKNVGLRFSFCSHMLLSWVLWQSPMGK